MKNTSELVKETEGGSERERERERETLARLVCVREV